MQTAHTRATLFSKNFAFSTKENAMQNELKMIFFAVVGLVVIVVVAAAGGGR